MKPNDRVTQSIKKSNTRAASWGGDGLLACPGSTGAIGENSPIPQGAAPFAGAGRFEPEAPRGVAGWQAKRRRLPPGHRFFGDCLREQCARWLDWAMGLAGDGFFFTNTFRNFVTEYRASHEIFRWLARISQAHRDKTGAGGTKSFCATEWQQREVIHYHLLVLGAELGALSRKRWEHRWWASGGGFARGYDAVMKAAPYLAKYMNKRLGGELKIGGAWLGSKPPKAIGRCCNTRQPASPGL